MQPKFEISNEDRMEIANMMQSRAWEVLTGQVWGPWAQWMRETITTIREDFRFAQGQYQGFVFAQQLAQKMSQPNPEVGYVKLASEMDLVSRRF